MATELLFEQAGIIFLLTRSAFFQLFIVFQTLIFSWKFIVSLVFIISLVLIIFQVFIGFQHLPKL